MFKSAICMARFELIVCHLDQYCTRKVIKDKLFCVYVAATGSNSTVGATDWILPIVYYDYRFVLGRMYRDGRKS